MSFFFAVLAWILLLPSFALTLATCQLIREGKRDIRLAGWVGVFLFVASLAWLITYYFSGRF